MRAVPLLGGPLRFEGAVELQTDAAGVTPLRLPAAVLPYLPPVFPFASSCCSGVRLCLVTDSRSLGLEVAQVNLAPVEGVAAFPVLYDLVVDGQLVATAAEPTGSLYDPFADSIEVGPDARIDFDLPGRGGKRVEIWLPLRSRITVRRVLVDDAASVEAPVDERRRWVVHGSSITHCAEALSPSRTWPAVAAQLGDVRLLNLGMGGNCLVEQWVARSIRDTPADLITLKLGVNVWNFAAMRARSFTAAVHGFLDTVRDGHPETPITVVSPIYCPGGEHAPGPSEVATDGRYVGRQGSSDADELTITAMRDLLAELVAVRRRGGDERLTYLDGRSLLGPADASHLPDGLHPDGAGYLLMGERYAGLELGVTPRPQA